MSYPGNQSLDAEVQRKIVDTFSQSLDLAASGKREEALLGCDFVLRLDPLYEPARTLQGRIEAQTGAVPVDDLAEELAAHLAGKDTSTDSPGEPPEEPVPTPGDATEEGEEFVLDLDDMTLSAPLEGVTKPPAPSPPTPPPPAPSPPAPSVDDEVARLASALDLDALTAEVEDDAPDDAPSPAQEPAPSDSEPTAALDQESADRIEELLSEGQTAFEQGEYQSAIDAWSRIFLVDIEHTEANRRIELARKLKAEVERKLEEKYHDALSKLESGQLEEARIAFADVLELQPGHLAAQEYLDRLSAGEFSRRPEAQADDEPALDDLPDIEPTPAPEGELSPDDFEFPTEEFEPFAPPSEPIESPTPAPQSSRRSLFLIAGLVLVVVLGAAWLLYDNWDRAFPSAEQEPAPQPVARVDPIDRATSLYIDGESAMAIAQLRRLPPAHPQFAEAQALIAQWEAADSEAEAEEVEPEQLAERDSLVAQAREAFANREFLLAEELFALAAQTAPLDGGTLALAAETADRLAPLRSEIEIFRQGEWAFALRTLWVKHQEEPGNLDVVRLMTDGYYNLALRELQRGDPVTALENLKEANSLDSGDEGVQRLMDFAETYRQRNQDLLYRIFVKYLPFR